MTTCTSPGGYLLSSAVAIVRIIPPNGKFERFNRTIKTGCIRPKAPLPLADAKRIVTDFIETYNYKRLHSSLGFVTPYDRLLGRHEEIFQARDAKLEAARARRKAVRERRLMAA